MYKRITCDPKHPWDGKTTPVTHVMAVCTGSTSDGAGDYFECPVCKTKWTNWYDGN